jgi:hypothetical protein
MASGIGVVCVNQTTEQQTALESVQPSPSQRLLGGLGCHLTMNLKQLRQMGVRVQLDFWIPEGMLRRVLTISARLDTFFDQVAKSDVVAIDR